MALRRARDAHGPLHLKEASFVIERADFRGVEVGPGGLVRHDRAVLPAVPEALHDVDELLGDLVAQIVLHVGFAAEIEGGLAGRARHHVPGRPALGDVVDGAEGSGHVVGFAEAGRHGGAEADVPGRGTQRRDERGLPIGRFEEFAKACALERASGFLLFPHRRFGQEGANNDQRDRWNQT